MNKIFFYLMLLILFAFQSLAQTNNKQEQWERFKQDYPGQLNIQWDDHSGGPKRIVGNNIFLNFGSIDKSNIETATREFILAHQDLLNFRGSELRINNIAELNNKFIVIYQQYYGNVPLWNVKLKMKIASNGHVLSIKSPLFSDLNISTSPAFDVEKAQKIAESEFGISAEQEMKDGELIIYPYLKSEAPVLCWHVKVINNEVQKGVMVDAHTGKIIFSFDLYRNEEIRGNVDIKTWSLPGQTDGTPDRTEDCQDLTVNVTGVGSDNTNSAGYYSVTVPNSGNYTVTSALEGPYCWVINVTGGEDSYSGTASTSADHNWTWQNSSHYNEYFVFYYMNKVWHEYLGKVSGFSSNYWYTHDMEGRANDDFDPGVNGRASGTWMGITPANHYGGSVYHEYTHNVIYQANGHWLGSDYNGDGRAMDEGFSDYYSCSFRNDPRRYAVDRRLDGKMKYPGSGGAHTRGQIIGGACWDLSAKTSMSLNIVNALAYESITNMNYEETFGDFMDEIFSADDNDGNIFNGTPHDDQIFDAFINDHAIAGSYLAGNVYTDVTAYSNLTLIDDVTITDATFTINSGVTMNLNGHSIYCQGTGRIVNNGTVSGYTNYAQSGSDYKGFFNSATDIQDIIDWSSSGWCIYIDSGEFTEDLSMKSGVDLIGENMVNTIIDGTIAFSNDDYAGIEELTVKDKITISNSDNVTLDHIKSGHSDCYIESVSSELALNNLYFDQSQAKAFYGHDCGYSDFYSGSFRYKNNQALYIHFFDTADLTDPYFCDNNFDIYVTPFSYVWVYGENSYFSSPTEGSTVTSGLVEWEDWYGCGGLAKILAQNGADDPVIVISSQDDSLDKRDYQQAMNKYRSIKYRLKEDRSDGKAVEPKKYESDYHEAIGDFKQVVANYPASLYAELALDRISASHRALKEYEELSEYMAGIASDSKCEQLRPHALSTLIPSYVDQEGYQQAIELSDQIIKEYPDHEIVVEKLYGKGLIYKYDLKDFDQAEQMFKTVIANYPEHMTAQSAKEELESMGKKYGEDEMAATESANKLSIENYPNPFNPQTTIRYHLAEASHVTIKIYNLLGKEVITLVDQTQLQGNHAIQWNGRDRFGNVVANGVYWLRMQAGKFVGHRKLVMTR